MKRLIVTLLVLGFLFIVGLQDVWSGVSLPTANVSGNAQTTAGIGTGTFTLEYAVISKVNYMDGTSTIVNSTNESIIGKKVTISGAIRTGDYSFTDATITITDGTFNYLTATLTDITFITDGVSWYLNPQLDVCKEETHNLSNIVLNTDATHPSRYIEEFQQGLDINDVSGMKMILLPMVGSLNSYSRLNISTGLIMGPPPIVEVDELPRSVGYWKNHDLETNCFTYDAVSDEIDVLDIFRGSQSATALWYYLTKTGKRTMEEKAKQQLAALLLNIAAGFETSTPLTPHQLLLINPNYASIPEGDGIEDTVGDAVIDIENAIRTGVDLERAKDLADAINNNSG